jgi:hypothetical protein
MTRIDQRPSVQIRAIRGHPPLEWFCIVAAPDGRAQTLVYAKF